MNTMDIALICKALGDSNRLQIVQMLSGEVCNNTANAVSPYEDPVGMRVGGSAERREVEPLFSELRHTDGI